MIDLFTPSKFLEVCPLNKHLGKCSNEILSALSLLDDGTLGTTAKFASALSIVNIVKISDLLAFLVMLLFSSLDVDF